MDKTRLRRISGVAMVAIGLLQAGLGGLDDNLVWALIGMTLALSGVAYLWVQGDVSSQ